MVEIRESAGLELDLCRAWTQLPRSIPLTTTEGLAIDVIHLGTWTHGFGPDFRDAIISIDSGPAISGSIEIHLRTRGWIEHKHHLDPRYNDVVLHVVGKHDLVETRRSDGKLVPTVALDIALTGVALQPVDWSVVGGEVCAESIARERPAVIRDALAGLGDLRMTRRSAVLESELARLSADELLYREIIEALGYSQNRTPMRALTEALPWQVLNSARSAGYSTLGCLLGAGGFLPLSDAELAHTGMAPGQLRKAHDDWQTVSTNWAIGSMPATSWVLARIRPLNHPIRRLAQFAAIIERTNGRLATELLAPIRTGLDPSENLLELVGDGGAPALGRDRARTIATNVLIPFAFAQAAATGDHDLAEATSALWVSLKAGEANERTRKGVRQIAGDAGLRRLTERHMQGLVHLTTQLCEPRRCYECPIARIVVSQ